MNATEEKALQEKYIELKIIEEQIKQTQNQANILKKQLIEVTLVTQNLEDFKKLKEKDEILVAITPGIFVKAELKNNKEFLINAGADIVVKKDIEMTKEMMVNQVEEIKKLYSKIIVCLQKFEVHASIVEKELDELASK